MRTGSGRRAAGYRGVFTGLSPLLCVLSAKGHIPFVPWAQHPARGPHRASEWLSVSTGMGSLTEMHILTVVRVQI